MKPNHRAGVGLIEFLLIVAAMLAAAIVGLVLPVNTSNLVSQSKPAQTYSQALDRLDRLERSENANVSPVCQSKVYGPGRKTERVIVILHGFTSCPEQMRFIANQLSVQGYNVLVPREPTHGFSDRLTNAPANLKPEQLTTWTDEVMDIAYGLGDQVTLVGLSGGGTLAAWASAYRADVKRTVLLAPLFMPAGYPSDLMEPITQLLLQTENWFTDFRPEVGQIQQQTGFGYPRYASRAIGAYLALSVATSRKALPQNIDMRVVTTANDITVNNETTARMIQRWKAQGIEPRLFQFSAAEAVPHDFFSRSLSEEKRTQIQNKLVEIITQP